MKLLAAAVLIALAVWLPAAKAEDTLYNGIRLPVIPMPRPKEVPHEPVPPSYLLSPPEVIPIDVGRQLFVDDFLIAETTLNRTFHLAKYYPGNPVLKPEKPWEMTGRGPMAQPFSGGVWHDPKDQQFKMWYGAGYSGGIALAYSDDGLTWQRPELDVKPGTNLVLPQSGDTSTVWLDLEEKDPAKRFKLFFSRSGGSTVKGAYGYATFFSPDGIHWSDPPRLTGSCGDRSTVFWNPFRKVWVYSLRQGWGVPRRRRYFETPDLINGPQWGLITNTYDGSVPWMWVGADALDPPRDDLNIPPQLYNLDAVAYESLILGLFTIWRGDARQAPQTGKAKEFNEAGRPKLNEVCLGFSRDGWQWTRPDRRAFCPVSENRGDWNWGNVQSAGGCCLVVGDKLYFYVSGRAGKSFPGSNDHDAGGSTGLAILRRDGFASMDAPPAEEGTLATRPVTFHGKHLFVNLDAPNGELQAEILNARGEMIQPFSFENCVPVKGDKTLEPVRWNGATDLSAVVGKPVQFRFRLRGGRLYSFWVSPDESGASHGYVAAGGPGYTGPLDTVGRAALKQ